MPFVRKCDKCGSVDSREQYKDAHEAADRDAFKDWTCPTCAWTEFDLVEAEEAEAPA